MTTTNNITNTDTINIYNNTDQTINPNPELLNNNPSIVYISTKVCKTCRTIKHITEFYKDKSRYDGYTYICKICNKDQREEYVEQNKDNISEHNKQYRELNKGKIAEHQKEYRELNKDKLSEQ